MDFASVAKAKPGDKVAVVSPSFAAPGVAPAIHEQALMRLRTLTKLEPVEFPTTRELGASARERADDLNAAFSDPEIRAVLATIGGEDQITVVPHLHAVLSGVIPSHFSATATTPTSSIGSGPVACLAITADRPKST